MNYYGEGNGNRGRGGREGSRFMLGAMAAFGISLVFWVALGLLVWWWWGWGS